MAVNDFEITAVTPRVQYIATVGQVDFVIPFRFFEDRDIEFFIGEDQVPSNDYTIVGAGTNDDGVLTVLTPMDGGEFITIARNSIIERVVNFQNSGDWQAQNVNDQLNRLTTYVQEVVLKSIDLAITIPVTSPLSQLTFPPGGAGYENRVIGFNEDGTDLIAGPSFSDVMNMGTIARNWAIKMDGPVEGSEYSAKYNAALAAASVVTAQAARDQAGVYAANAAAKALEAAGYVQVASEWAENPEDVPVIPGHFSALHYAAKAQQFAIKNGEVRLDNESAVLVLRPYGGGHIVVNGNTYVIDSPLSLATGPVNGTVYNIFLAEDGSGGLELVASTDAWEYNNVGIPVRAGVPEQSLVGKSKTLNAGGGWNTVPTMTLSWYNRREKKQKTTQGSMASTSSGTFLEMNSAFRGVLLTWGDEQVDVNLLARVNVNQVNGSCGTSLVLYDPVNVSTPFGHTMYTWSSTTGAWNNVSRSTSGKVDEGEYYGTLNWNTSAGTAQLAGANDSSASVLEVTTRG